ECGARRGGGGLLGAESVAIELRRFDPSCGSQRTKPRLVRAVEPKGNTSARAAARQSGEQGDRRQIEDRRTHREVPCLECLDKIRRSSPRGSHRALLPATRSWSSRRLDSEPFSPI